MDRTEAEMYSIAFIKRRDLADVPEYVLRQHIHRALEVFEREARPNKRKRAERKVQFASEARFYHDDEGQIFVHTVKPFDGPHPSAKTVEDIMWKCMNTGDLYTKDEVKVSVPAHEYEYVLSSLLSLVSAIEACDKYVKSLLNQKLKFKKDCLPRVRSVIDWLHVLVSESR